MKSTIFESREAWMNWRLGKITGSRLKEVLSFKEGVIKPAVFEIAAESIIGPAALAENDLSKSQVLERGHELEPVAIAKFESVTGKKVTRGIVGWESDDDTRMAVSPDGAIGVTEAVEVKCLLSSKHLEALYTRAIPRNTAGYDEQMLQYFIVNKKLRKLHFAFYHPDFPTPLDFFYVTFTRKELADDIAKYEIAEREAAATVRIIVNAVTLYSPEEIAKVAAREKELLAPEYDTTHA